MKPSADLINKCAIIGCLCAIAVVLSVIEGYLAIRGLKVSGELNNLVIAVVSGLFGLLGRTGTEKAPPAAV